MTMFYKHHSSDSVRELDFYRKIGLVAFGPLVGRDSAMFQPIYLTLENLRSDFKKD